MLGEEQQIDPALVQGAVPVEQSQTRVDPDDREENNDVRTERSAVKRWQGLINDAKEKWNADFERMRDNMDFVAGLQWPKQAKIRTSDYVVNMVIRAVNQGVATLYAKDPKVSARRRQRLDFAIWDGKIETIQQALQIVQVAEMGGFQVPPDITALLNDFQQGRMRQQLLDKIGKTLEIVCQYQIDTQQPNFKTQMKQLVRRVRVCGVGYIKVLFCRDYEDKMTQAVTRVSATDRAKMAREILEQIEREDIQEDDAKVEELKNLIMSLGQSPLDYSSVKVKEHLTFDFPQATSIIPDPDMRSLKGFVGAKWIVEEFYYALSYVNAFYETKITSGGELKTFGPNKREQDNGSTSLDENKDQMVRVWEITDLQTKSTWVQVDGWKDYVSKPAPLDPMTKGFWNIVPVTFNDVEVEAKCKATPFPPSDVDLMFSAQVEWNTVRQKLSRHRNANGPRYVYNEGSMLSDDIDRVTGSEDQEFIPLKGVPPGTDLNKVITPLTVSPIRPELYLTDPLREDILLATGQQEANLGPALPGVTATVGTIAEQSRMSVAASDVDGLDDSLTVLFQCGGEMMLREMSGDTVRHIAGPGAVWPESNKEDFINEINLEVVAASSGRPNKALEVANWERIANLVMQAGGNPQAVIKESIKRLDDRIDPTDFFPIQPPAAPMGQPPTGGEQQNGQPSPSKPKGQGQPPQPNASGAAMPLVGHNQ